MSGGSLLHYGQTHLVKPPERLGKGFGKDEGENEGRK